MTDPWVDGARPDEARTAPRGRLAILLAVALALPVLIVALGSRTEPPTLIESAGAAPTQVATQVTDAPTTAAAEDSTTTSEEPTTEAEASTTAWRSTSTTPTTSWSTSTASTRSSSAASSSTATAAPTTTRPVAKAVAPTTAAPVTAPPTTSRPVVTAPPASQSAAAFLACVRQRESGGNYGIDTGNGYYGAYQFAQSTWDYAAGSLAHRPDLVGRRPNLASPADQDAVALALYNASGPAPWGGSCH